MKKIKQIPRRHIYLLLAICIFVVGCGHTDICKFDTGYSSHSFFFHAGKSPIISFIKNKLPSKTYLFLLDPIAKKAKKYRFENYGFNGPHEILSEINLAVVSAIYIKSTGFDAAYLRKLLIIDLSRQIIKKEFLLPSDCNPILLHRPRWDNKIYILMKVQEDPYGNTYFDNEQNNSTGRTALKSLDLNNYSLSDSILIGNFIPMATLFLEDTPLLSLDVAEPGSDSIVIYDTKSKSIIRRYPIIGRVVEFKEGNREGSIVAITKIAGENKGNIIECDVKDNACKILTTINGEPESMLVIDDLLYVISKDLSRSDKQRKSWLHPRNLYTYNLKTNAMESVLDWTDRNGKLIGYDAKNNNLYFAVIDNDRPGLWTIVNRRNVLAGVRRVIR